MLITNHSWDHSSTAIQPSTAAITQDIQTSGSQRYRIYTREPVGGSP